MVKKTSCYLLFYCALIWGIFLVGCSSYQPYQVYQDQYVVERIQTDGPFNPWKPGVRNTPELPAGVYDIHATGVYELVSTKLGTLSESKLVEYDAQNDLCLTDEFKNFVCSPNYQINGILSNDPDFDKLWGLKNPPGVNIASITTDKRAPDVKVMVLDTGVNCNHEDIECSHLTYNAITGSTTIGDAGDDNGHGTHVAGTIGAIGNNGKGISGVATQTPIVPAKFLTASGSGSLYNAIKAVRWAIQNNIDIINASFGGGGYSESFQNVINEASEVGILFIAAAGNNSNDNDSRPHYPSNYDNALSVASVDKSGRLSSFSNYGKNTVHVAAPGRDIYSLNYRGGYYSLSGTSMATPHVAGLASLIYQKYKHLPRTERRKIAWDALTNGVRQQHTDKVIYGEIDAPKVLGSKPPCDRATCKKCIAKCVKRHKCKCVKLAKCKTACREKTGCKGACQ